MDSGYSHESVFPDPPLETCGVAHNWRLMSAGVLLSEFDEDVTYRAFECTRCGEVKLVSYKTDVTTRVVAQGGGVR
jgi:hypothetical protein